jgi:predicted nucleotidyltransferase
MFSSIMDSQAIQQKFTVALDALVERVKEDRSVLAAILCGSLSHDIVWTKSDIDLVLVTIDDKKSGEQDLALYADGLNVHVMLLPRTEFRQTVEGAVHNSFIHSFLAKGRLLYSHDPTIEDLCARLRTLGQRDAALHLLRAATYALLPIDKAHKWFVTRGDLEYTALWILYAATPLAQIELIGAGQLIDREVIPRALQLNPAFFKTVYTDLLNQSKTKASVKAALDAIDVYLAGRASTVFAPVIDYLRDVGDIRSSKEIEHHFEKHFGIRGVTTACEYLADRGLLGKAGSPVHLTKKSNIEMQELAFFFSAEEPGAV